MRALMAKAMRALAPLAACLALIGTAGAAPNCTVSTTPVAFGDYTGSSAAASTGRISYTCSTPMPVSIALDSGINSPTFTTRNLRRIGGNEVIHYNLYLDPATTQIWGNGTGGSSLYTNVSPAPNTAVVVTIFGRIPSRQANLRSGVYSDTLTLTISW